MASFLREVLKGVKNEILEEQEVLDRLKKFGKLSGILAAELTAAVALTPFGIRALRVKRSLPVAFTAAADSSPLGVVLFPSIRYGPQPRQQLDVFVPDHLYQHILKHQGTLPPLQQHSSSSTTGAPATPAAGPPSTAGATPAAQHGTRSSGRGTNLSSSLNGSNSSSSSPATLCSCPGASCPSVSPSSAPAPQPATAPVVFFCHGGIWATGERWHFIPMATRLAQSAGAIVVVISYTLYPDALATQMACEVLEALLWTLNNIQRFLGDPLQVSVVGHSAGGHLGALAVLLLAQQRRLEQQQQQQQGALDGRSSSSQHQGPGPWRLQPEREREPRGLLQPNSSAARAGPHQQQQHQQRSVWQQWEQEEACAPDSSSSSSSIPNPGLRPAAGNGVSRTPVAASPAAAGSTQLLTPLHSRPAAAAAPEAATGSGAGAQLSVPLWRRQAPGSALALPLPVRFIGMSGVYDVAKHFEFEMSRGVHQLSTMARACGGPVQMIDVSPVTVLVRAATAAAAAVAPQGVPRAIAAPLNQQPQGNQWQQQEQQVFSPTGAAGAAARAAVPGLDSGPWDVPLAGGVEGSARVSGFYDGFALAGEAIPVRAGLEGPDRRPAAAATANNSSSSKGTSHGALPQPYHSSSSSSSSRMGSGGGVGRQGTLAGWHGMDAAAALLRFSRGAAAHVPPVILMSSCGDHMVPWHEAAEMAAALGACGVPVKHLIYNKPKHNDFVMDWPVLRQGASSSNDSSGAKGGVAAGPGNTQQQQQLLQEGGDLIPPRRQLPAADARNAGMAIPGAAAAAAAGSTAAGVVIDSSILGLPDFGRDLVNVVARRVKVQYAMSRL